MNKILYSKTPRQLVSEIIAVLGFILLSISFKVNALEFNYMEFTNQVQKIYTLDQSVQLLNSKDLIDEIFDVKDIRIREALNTICENEVGDMMIKLFYQNREKMGNRLKLKSKHFERDGKKARNVFVNDEFTVFLSPRRIAGIKTVGFCDNKISEKSESLDSVLFHELGHALHYLMNRDRINGTESLDNIYGHSEEKYLWTYKETASDEEFFNITGYYYSGGNWYFDPLSTNMYDICKQSKAENLRSEIKQRLFHCAYKSDLQGDISLVERFVLDLKIWLLDKE